ncbi:activator of s-phase kinase-related [Anaeramoeba flamelloides]|uniref:Activator of s-phase kinase-related n=1 Tax=Anaeramoeba flamelloides TaxID=1746091 RepID=A0ABQ8Z2S5_9EUKA|nr:activator of s-phase kinase-related [Anaeramoeba flamelloides]
MNSPQQKTLLKGVVFYLDIQDQKILHDTLKKLRYFGAEIATFLSSRIQCFVTDQFDTSLQSQHHKFKQRQPSSPLVSLTSTPYQQSPSTQELQNPNNFGSSIISSRSSRMLLSPQFNQLLNKQQTPISIAIKLGIKISSVQTIRGWLNKNLSRNKFSASRNKLNQIYQQKSNEKHNQTKNENYHLKEYLQKRNSTKNSVLLRSRFSNKLNFQPRVKKKRRYGGIPQQFQKPQLRIKKEKEKEKEKEIQEKEKMIQLKTQHKLKVHEGEPILEKTNVTNQEDIDTDMNLVQTEFLYPYIYIENSNVPFYKPLYKEFTEKKIPETRGFIYKRSKQRNKGYSLKFLKEKRKLKKRPRRKKKTKGSGFCVICCKRYTILEDHVLEQKHQEFAKNDENYQKIEDLFLKVSNFGFFGNELQVESQNSNGNGTQVENPELKIQKNYRKKKMKIQNSKSNSQHTSQIEKKKKIKSPITAPRNEHQEFLSAGTELHTIESLSTIGNQNIPLNTQSSISENEIILKNNLDEDDDDITGNNIKPVDAQLKKQNQMLIKSTKNRKRKKTTKYLKKKQNITSPDLEKEKKHLKDNNNNIIDGNGKEDGGDYDYDDGCGEDDDNNDDKNNFLENERKLKNKKKKKKLNSSNETENENEKYVNNFKHNNRDLSNENVRFEETQKIFTLEQQQNYHQKSLQKLKNETLHQYFPFSTTKQTGLVTYLQNKGIRRKRIRRQYFNRK